MYVSVDQSCELEIAARLLHGELDGETKRLELFLPSLIIGNCNVVATWHSIRQDAILHVHHVQRSSSQLTRDSSGLKL